jgi:hypothetical protein
MDRFSVAAVSQLPSREKRNDTNRSRKGPSSFASSVPLAGSIRTIAPSPAATAQTPPSREKVVGAGPLPVERRDTKPGCHEPTRHKRASRAVAVASHAPPGLKAACAGPPTDRVATRLLVVVSHTHT